MNSLIDFYFKLAKNEDIHEHYTARHRRDLKKSKDKQGKTTTNVSSFFRL